MLYLDCKSAIKQVKPFTIEQGQKKRKEMNKTQTKHNVWTYQAKDSQLVRDIEGNIICDVELPRIKYLGYDECALIQQENGKLIAAAPELLEACKIALTIPELKSGQYQEIYRIIDQVITKAEEV